VFRAPTWLSAFLTCAAAAQDDAARRAALDRELANLPQGGAPDMPAATKSAFQLLDVSLDLLVAAGSSTERDAVLQGGLQGGAHDPRRRGFTLQQAELGIVGAVDPYFRAQAYLIASIDPAEGETVTELEEAFLTTTALPGGLQLELGQFFTEFGRLNPRHPHEWHWVDQPFVHSRIFGGDGIRAPGARLSWLLPTETFAELHFGLQDGSGETMTSFLANDEVYGERPIGGRLFGARETRSWNDLVWLARAVTGFDAGAAHSAQFGASMLFGPNPTGGDAATAVYGVDGVWKWRPPDAEAGWPFVIVEAEALLRSFEADDQVDVNDPTDPSDDVFVPGDTLGDWGGYLQGLWGFRRGWAAGLRVEWGSGSGAGYDAGADMLVDRSVDPYRADRLRLSPLLAWHPSEFSRVRLQYNYDRADWLDGEDVHSVWLGFEVSIGSHPAHRY
jgi:hypothetical protein